MASCYGWTGEDYFTSESCTYNREIPRFRSSSTMTMWIVGTGLLVVTGWEMGLHGQNMHVQGQ